jgi:multiple sugar transport system substrate-binding protein
VKALTWQTTYARTYGIEHLDALTQSAVTYTTQDPFLTGRLAMIIDLSARDLFMTYYQSKIRYGVSHQPYPRQGGQEILWQSGEALAIPRGAKEPERAWEFMRWHSAGPGSVLWCALNGFLPAYKPALANPAFTPRSPAQKTILNIVRSAAIKTEVPCPAENVYADALRSARDQATHLQLTPQQALDAAAQTTQLAVDQFLSHYHG